MRKQLRPDVAAMDRQYGIGRIFRTETRTISNMLRQDEQVFVMSLFTKAKVLQNQLINNDYDYGVICVTNLRVIIVKSIPFETVRVEEFPVSELHSIHKDNNQVQFGTSMKLALVDCAHADEVEQALRHVGTGTPPAQTVFAPQQPTVASALPLQEIRVTCQSCGAHALVMPGTAIKCLYCDGLVQA